MPPLYILKTFMVRERHAPVGALRLSRRVILVDNDVVREHHAPVGALRHLGKEPEKESHDFVREHHAPVGALRRGQSSRISRLKLSGSTTHL